MSRPIRVVSIVEAWFVTGQAKNLLEFAKRARSSSDGRRAVDLSLVTYERGPGAGQRNQFVIAAREAGITLDLVTESGRFDFSVPKRLNDIIAERDPDIVQTHNVKSHFLMRYSGLRSRRTWLAFHHGYTTTDAKMRFYNQLDRWSLRAADRVVTVCRAFAKDLSRTGIPPDRIVVRHNSVKPFQRPGPGIVERIHAGLPSGAAILLVVGRLSREKGHADLLNALDILRRRTRHCFHAVFVGDGPERRSLESARRKLGLDDFVTMAGLQHDVRPYYALATAVVLPSHSEGSPNVLLEAMSAEVPVVATCVGGVPEIASDGQNALLVESRNPEMMAAALQRILEDEGLRLRIAAEGKRTADEHYSPDAHGKALVEIYERVLQRTD